MEIAVIQGDITRCETGAIVNAANAGLLGGGGVDGAIHRAAGPELRAACEKIARKKRDNPGGPCPAGDAVITGAGRLPCKNVIHTVGPFWRGGGAGEAELLASCYRKSLALAEEAQLESIAFPNIATGVYGYPKTEAARIAFGTVREAAEKCRSVKKVIFVCFDRENYAIYTALAAGASS